jgi:hypothetical protein
VNQGYLVRSSGKVIISQLALLSNPALDILILSCQEDTAKVKTILLKPEHA